MANRISRRAVACALFAGTSLLGLSAAPAQAQMKRPVPDEHGIDVVSGVPYIPSGKLTIGDPSKGGLDFYRIWQGGGWFDNLGGTVAVAGTVYTITVGSSVETFTLSGTTYNSDDGRGSTLTKSVSGVWTYTLADGTIITFENPGTLDGGASLKGMISSIARPNGFVATFTNQYQPFCEKAGTKCDTPNVWLVRLKSVTTNTGYQLHLDYIRNTTSSTPSDLAFEAGWSQLATVTALNNSVDYCAPSADSCSFTQSWPAVTISTRSGTPGVFTDTWVDSLTHTTTAQVTGSQLASIQSPADPSTDFSLTYDTSNRVASFAQGGGTWNYTYSDVGTQRTTTVTQPLGGSKVYVSDTSARKLQSVTDELGHTTSYSYDSNVRPTQITQPEGNYTQLTYDARGNVTQKTEVAKAGSGLANIVTSASYDATCSNPKTCNQPNYTLDAKGNETDYTYDGTHGGVLTVTQSAPTAGAVRAQTRFGYTALSAYYKNSSGVIAAAPTSIYKLTSTSACQTGSSCAGTSDEVKSTIAYGATGVANNLLPTSVSKGSGDGVLTATIAAAYDIFGNVTSVDGPLPGTADTSTFTYDSDRQLTLAVSPDPDGPGTGLQPRARRFTYDANGNVTKIELGTFAGLPGTFTPASSGEREEIAYDSLGRMITDSMASGTSSPVTNTLTQYSYDTKGRPNCIAMRMNPSIYGSLPSDACTLGTAGSFGNDRINQAVYDNADEVTQLKEAVGDATYAATDETLSYSNNGQVTYLLDAENNLTAYIYDGFDRLSKTLYPNPNKGSIDSNGSDYEQLSYDPNGNITSGRLRDGNSIGFTYDNLNRVTFKDLPGTEPDVTYAYDNLGRLTSASQTGISLSFVYDALSRETSETGPIGTVNQQFDLAGRRTQLSAPGYLLNFQRLTTGEMKSITDVNSTTLASFNYDDLGRRTGLSYSDGSSASWSYDAVSRLSALGHDFSGTANDLTKTFAYNPASQIVGETRSNDAYAYGGDYDVNRGYTSNGLNQYSAAGAASFSYDTKGNLTSDGTNTFGYSSESLLSSSTNGGVTTLTYDPLGRLYSTTSSSGTHRFLYAPGDSGAPEVIGDVASTGSVNHYYGYGPGPDEPLLWWDFGAGIFRLLHADERGSVIAVSDGTGAAPAINNYDEYGIPGSANLGRFQYTGQAWIPEIGMQYSKARMYSPTLGRFMQTDPIGYGDGPNWYAYTRNDPVNGIDPTGLLTSAECEALKAKEEAKGNPVICGTRSDPPPSLPGGSLPGGNPIVVIGVGGCTGNCKAIVVTARKARSNVKRVLNDLVQCAAAQYGLGDGQTQPGINLAKGISELGSLPVFKPLVGIPVIGNSSRFTNVFNYSSHLLGINARFTGVAAGVSRAAFGSIRVATVLGRANVIVGGALLAYDLTSIALCTARKN